MEKFKRKFHTLPNSKKIKIKIGTIPFLFVPYNFCGILGVPSRIGRRKTDISFFCPLSIWLSGAPLLPLIPIPKGCGFDLQFIQNRLRCAYVYHQVKIYIY